MKGNIMDINLRADAPDQSDIIDPKKLSEEVEKLKSLQSRIKTLEDQVKDLKEERNDSERVKSSQPEEKKIYTRSRGQKSLFEFGSEEKSDPWKPILDGRDDLNRQ